MKTIPIVFKVIRQYINRMKHIIELNKYDNFTIAEYFRNQGAQIGDGCSILIHSLGDEPYLVKIGNHVTIAQGVAFVTHDGGAWIFRNEIPDIQVLGLIIIEDNCVIGANAMLFPNVRIGRNSIISAGSVVISDVPPNSIAMGVPARVLGSVEKYKEKCIARWKVQRPPDCIIEKGCNWWNSRHLDENRKKLKKHLINIFWKQKNQQNNL